MNENIMLLFFHENDQEYWYWIAADWRDDERKEKKKTKELVGQVELVNRGREFKFAKCQILFSTLKYVCRCARVRVYE